MVQASSDGPLKLRYDEGRPRHRKFARTLPIEPSAKQSHQELTPNQTYAARSS